jgi:hypothetical protein
LNRVPGEETRNLLRGLEDALNRLDPLTLSRGQMVATDGLTDLRLGVERAFIEVELDGLALPKNVTGEQQLVRAVVDVLFWDAPIFDVFGGAIEPAGGRPTFKIPRQDGAREVVRAIKDELAKLEPVRRKVPTLNIGIDATATTRAAKSGSPVAQKLRAALVAKGGELSLAEWTRAEGLDAGTAASAFAELLDAGEARVSRKQDPAAAAARLEAAGGGFVPGLRLERAARGIGPRDPVAASKAYVRAGSERLASGRVSEALDDFQQALAGDQSILPDLGLAAREGLLLALEAEVKAGEGAGKAARPPGEAKRSALELGRLYLALGYSNRARLALERGIEDSSSPATHLELVTALLGAGQAARALERSIALAPALDREARRALAQRFVDAGAKGPTLERALALAGGANERTASHAALAVAAVLTLLAVLFGVEASALAQVARASNEARAKLESGGPTAEVATAFETAIPASSFRAGGVARGIATELTALAQDARLLAGGRDAVAWRASENPEEARAKLKLLLDKAQTDALRARLTESLAAFDRWAGEARNEISALKESALVGGKDALDIGRRVIERYPTWRASWKDVTVPIHVFPTPGDAVVEWEGEKTGPSDTFALRLDSPQGTLRVSGETGSGWLATERHLTIDELTPVVTVTLERAGGVGSHPDPRHPVAPIAPPIGGPRPKIKITGDPTPPVVTAQPTDTPPAPEETDPHFEVRDASGADVQALLPGTSTVTIDPSPGYFDYLKRDVPERFKLTVDIETRVRDKLVYLTGVTVRLEDLVLGKNISPRFAELEKACVRPLRPNDNGTRSIGALGKTEGLDQPKFRMAVGDTLRAMVHDFMKSETGR